MAKYNQGSGNSNIRQTPGPHCKHGFIWDGTNCIPNMSPVYDCIEDTWNCPSWATSCVPNCSIGAVTPQYICCPEAWIGDGVCDDANQTYGCDLSCYENEAGDCR